MAANKFETREILTEDGSVFARLGGTGPPVLLLHGFPQTSLMWREVAPMLAEEFTVVAADLPGYGQSACPADEGDNHQSMSKRTMANTLVEAMRVLGHQRFAVVGHDRGGRVAYRMALDHPEVVTHLAVLDIIPTADVWARADARLMLAFWPFSLLAQDEPLPERLILGAPDAVVDAALSGWGSPPDVFPPEIRKAYIEALSDPAHVHAICEDYRAAAGVDPEHDEADQQAGRRIDCPLLSLWSAEGPLGTWYDEVGGPIGIWSRWASHVTGEPVRGGHFFPEEYPPETVERLRTFLRSAG